MNDLFPFIFLVKGGKIAAYREVGEKFICRSFNGEEYVSFNADFWKIWQETFSFVPEFFCIDFAFVSTDPRLQDFLLPDNFKMAEHSGWTTSKVKAFMQGLFPVLPYNLWEDNVPLHSVPDKIADDYYVTRFNIEKEKRREEKPSSVYDHMVKDPLPAELLEELQKKL